MINKLKILISCLFCCILFGCGQESTTQVDKQEQAKVTIDVDYSDLPSINENGSVNAVIEIPAGTNKKYEYDEELETFEIDQKNGRDRIIEFLSYPGNYGYIPSTIMDTSEGGDGDPLDILVISESVPQGTVMEVTPIALLSLLDDGEIDEKIIAVPSKIEDRTMYAANYTQIETDFPALKIILKEWFVNYKGIDKCRFMGWRDEKAAVEQIKLWTVE